MHPSVAPARHVLGIAPGEMLLAVVRQGERSAAWFVERGGTVVTWDGWYLDDRIGPLQTLPLDGELDEDTWHNVRAIQRQQLLTALECVVIDLAGGSPLTVAVGVRLSVQETPLPSDEQELVTGDMVAAVNLGRMNESALVESVTLPAS